MKTTLLSLMLLAFSLAGTAQSIPEPSESTLTAMNKLAPLAGIWEGEGWMQARDFRTEFKQQEDIHLKLDGSVLEINGLGLSKLDGDTVHHALALVSYDDQEKRYKMYAMRGDGQAGEVKAHLNDAGAFVWEMEAGNGGQIQYIISFDDTHWNETGRFSPDGKMWYDFFKMDLKKVEDR